MLHKVITLWQLGLLSLYRVLRYRLSVKLGVNPVRRIRHSEVQGEFFQRNMPVNPAGHVNDSRWQKSLLFFHWKQFEFDSEFPRWHFDYFHQVAINQPGRDWWTIGDFEEGVKDIKLFWELSRFDWLLVLAMRANAASGQNSLKQLNDWLNDWVKQNPFYKGPNWKCGQEASIRVMHLAMASVLLEQNEKLTRPLASVLEAHLKRIWPTISYAMGQNNNHGTSEAAALFIGGSWLNQKNNNALTQKWEKSGRFWLEDRINCLILNDGTFSQYSLNYHRLLLDTLCMVEIWRIKCELPRFSENFYKKALLATMWLYRLISETDGDGPNLGANDGARLFPLTDTDYRDYRPTVQTAAVLFAGKRAYSREGKYDEPCRQVNLPLPDESLTEPNSFHCTEGGMILLRENHNRLLLRYPKFEFRPGQADILHLDFWVGNTNILRDAGSFSYNASENDQLYFNGVEGHNTVQFDGHQPMPKISRFLWGSWLSTKGEVKVDFSAGSQTIDVQYRDYKGCFHRRKITLTKSKLVVADFVSKFKERATIRWRLPKGDCKLEENVLVFPGGKIRIEADSPVNMNLASGWESKYYLQKSKIPVLEITTEFDTTIKTEVIF